MSLRSSSTEIAGKVDYYATSEQAAMNKIVRQHYPVANLPQDLREGLADDATVRIVLEVEDAADDSTLGPGDFKTKPRKPLNRTEALEAIRRFKALDRPAVGLEEAVERIRTLRDEWND